MNRFIPKRHVSVSFIGGMVSFLFLLIFLIYFIFGISKIDESTLNEQALNLDRAVRRSVTQCYAVEGTYPPSLDYLVEHYGLQYDKKLFFIDYTPIGSNIMPDITILPKQSPRN